MNLEEIKTMVSKIEEMTAELDAYRGRVSTLEDAVLRYQGKEASLERLLGEFIKEETVEQDIIEQIAEPFDISLTKTIEGTVTVTWSFSAEVSLGDTVDDLDFSAELMAHGSDDIEIDQEDIEIN